MHLGVCRKTTASLDFLCPVEKRRGKEMATFRASIASAPTIAETRSSQIVPDVLRLAAELSKLDTC